MATAAESTDQIKERVQMVSVQGEPNKRNTLSYSSP
jgi:hypothetical protein